MRAIALLFLTAATLGSGGIAMSGRAQGAVSAPADGERQAIEAMFERWLEAYEQGDAVSLADLFTKNAIYAANTGEVLKGRAGIRAGVGAWMKGASRVGQQRSTAKLDLVRQQLRFRREGSLAYDLARFTIYMNPPGCVVDAGHALAVLKRQTDGRWLIDALTVNRDIQRPENACPR